MDADRTLTFSRKMSDNHIVQLIGGPQFPLRELYSSICRAHGLGSDSFASHDNYMIKDTHKFQEPNSDIEVHKL